MSGRRPGSGRFTPGAEPIAGTKSSAGSLSPICSPGQTCPGRPSCPRRNRTAWGQRPEQRLKIYAEGEAGPLVLRSAGEWVEKDAGIEPATITHLVTRNMHRFSGPGLDFALIQGLDLAPTVERTQIQFMGCHAALNGPGSQRHSLQADPSAVVLVAAVELCSLHYYYGSRSDRLIANAIFADGAATIVGTAGDGPWRIAATGSCLLPDSADDMAWIIGDHGFEMTLSRKVPGKIATHLKPWFAGWLARNDLSVEAIGSWAVHPGGPKILTAVEEGLDLPARRSGHVPRCLRRLQGTCQVPTVLFILDRLRNRQRPPAVRRPRVRPRPRGGSHAVPISCVANNRAKLK